MLSHKRNAAVARNARLYSAAGTSASSSGPLTPNCFCSVIDLLLLARQQALQRFQLGAPLVH